jgi:hypothetical protein
VNTNKNKHQKILCQSTSLKLGKKKIQQKMEKLLRKQQPEAINPGAGSEKLNNYLTKITTQSS